MQTNRAELEPIFEKWIRTEPNPNRLLKNEVEPNRTQIRNSGSIRSLICIDVIQLETVDPNIM